MIRYCVIIAVTLIYSHSANAGAWFDEDKTKIENHLRKELEPDSFLGKVIGKSSEQRPDFLCEVLSPVDKATICGEITFKLLHKYHKEFESFADTDLPKQSIANNNDPYKCEERTIQGLNMKKNMIYCGATPYKKKSLDDFGEVPGFYCAESRKTVGRVFVFRQSPEKNAEVSPIGELNGCEEIIRNVAQYKKQHGSRCF